MDLEFTFSSASDNVSSGKSFKLAESTLADLQISPTNILSSRFAINTAAAPTVFKDFVAHSLAFLSLSVTLIIPVLVVAYVS